MKKRWRWDFEPVMDNIVGWDLVKVETNEDDISNKIGFVYVTEDLDESKKNISLIGAAPELLEMCKKTLKYIDKTSPLCEELKFVINKAEGSNADIEKIIFFDDKEDLRQNFVMNMDFESDKLTFIPEAKMSDLFSLEEFDEGVGLIKLNISGDYIYNTGDELFDLRYPIGHIMGKNVFKDYVAFMGAKYKSLDDFMQEYEKEDEEVSLHMFLYDMFFEEFAHKYKRELNLNEYLGMYPLVFDTESLYIALNVPNFLEGCSHTVHVEMDVTCNNQTTKGVVFYKEKEKKFYVYNVENKSIAFFIINNTETDKNNTTLKFIDLVQK